MHCDSPLKYHYNLTTSPPIIAYWLTGTFINMPALPAGRYVTFLDPASEVAARKGLVETADVCRWTTHRYPSMPRYV